VRDKRRSRAELTTLLLVRGSQSPLSKRSAGLVGSHYACTSTAGLPLWVRKSCYSFGITFLSDLSFIVILYGFVVCPRGRGSSRGLLIKMEVLGRR
jgi:hypothetical protein